MEPMTIAAIGAVAVKTISGIMGSMQGADAAEDAARKTAQLTYAQRMEQLRIKQIEDLRTYGLGRSAAYASNLQMSGSPKKYLDVMRTEQLRAQKNFQNFAKKEREYTLEGGESPGLGAAVIGQAAGGLSEMFGAYKAGQ